MPVESVGVRSWIRRCTWFGIRQNDRTIHPARSTVFLRRAMYRW
jgi:hypothetical protein